MFLYSLIYDDTKEAVKGFECTTQGSIAKFFGRKSGSIAHSIQTNSLIAGKYRIVLVSEGEQEKEVEMPAEFHIEWNQLMRRFQKNVDWVSKDNVTADCLCVVHVGDSSFRAERMGM